MANLWRMSLFTCLLAIATGAGGGEWRPTGNLNVPKRGYEGALLTDGRILIAGGQGDGNAYEIFDPATGMWARSSMSVTNTVHTIGMLLPTGEVLYVTGFSGLIYDPPANTWRNSAASFSWTEYGAGTLLKNGKVLLMYNCRDAKLYDYESDAVTSTGSSPVEHRTAVEVLLPDGKVLVMGGSLLSACDFYDPGSGTWSSAASMSYSRERFVGVLLPPPWKKVLVAGQGSFMGSECEIYDIVSNVWSRTGDLSDPDRRATSMVLLPSGKPMIIGSDYSNTCEVYDPVSGQWSFDNSMMNARGHFSAVVLPTGKVLAIGGINLSGGNQSTCELYDPSEGAWAPSPCLRSKREAHTVTPLPIIHTANCSTNVLIVGGSSLTGALESCELYNYMDERVTTTGNLNIARSNHTAILLNSGSVLIAGGKGSGTALNSCEIYDPRTETFTSTGDLTGSRFNHTATLLQDGESILVTGGMGSSGDYESSCEIFASNVWNAGSNMNTRRAYHSAIFLLDGRILVAGGVNSSGLIDSCEIWNPGVGNWITTGSLINARCYHTAVLLQSSKVLVIGGKGSAGATASCEIYDPATGNWSAEATLNNARFLHNTTLLYSGLILAAGGYDGTGCLSSCEVYDPATQTWETTGSLNTARGYHASVLVPGDKPYVIATGGENNGQLLNSIETYDVGLGYLPQWQSEITNYPSIVSISDSMRVEGKLFRGVSEADGGNHCHVMSSDHPIMSLLRVGGGNFQGNGGGDILYMPPSSSWSETHTVVHPQTDAPKGLYRMWSVVNGIPCKWYSTCVAAEESRQSTDNGPQLTVFPNPSTSGAGVHLRLGLSTMDSGPSTLTIYDLAGRLVRSLEITRSTDQQMTEMTVDGLKAGVYFCKIKCQGSYITDKFTVLE
jgi:hypothetical protein